MQEGENLSREQIEDEIKKIKEAHAEDEGIYVFWTNNSVLQSIATYLLPTFCIKSE